MPQPPKYAQDSDSHRDPVLDFTFDLDCKEFNLCRSMSNCNRLTTQLLTLEMVRVRGITATGSP